MNLDCIATSNNLCLLNKITIQELQVLDWISQFHNEFLDTVLPVISSFANGGIGWILLSILLLCFPKYRKTGLTMAFSLLFCLLIGNLTLKPWIARMRPYSYFPEMTLLIPPLDDFSFPSGHTFASFAAATALFLSSRKAGFAAYLLALIIAFSRLYLYVHFPTDVLAGMLLGIFSGLISHQIIFHLKSHLL